MLKISTLRWISQIAFFLVIVYLGYFGVRLIQVHKIALVLPTLSCYYTDHRIACCALRSLQEGLSGGWKVGYTNLIPAVILFVVFGVILGRSWCSWVCPVGCVQDVFIRIRKLLGAGYYSLSDNLKVAATFVKWFLVIALVCVAAGIGIPHFFMKEYQYDLITPFCQICPGKQIFPCVEGRFKVMLRVDNITMLTSVMGWLAIVIFTFFLVTTSFIRRMWCRLCPIAALLGLLNRFSLVSLRKEGKRCTKCGICLRSCPAQVKEVYEEKEKERIVSSGCTLCFRCVEMCPEKDALKIAVLKRPIVSSKFRRFLCSGAVRAPKSPKEKKR